MSENKLYVGNFPYSVTEKDLRDVFQAYGDIESVNVIVDRETGRSKGFAFVTFSSADAASKALEQNGKELGGRPLKVNVAQEKAPRSGGGNGGGGHRSGGGGGRQSRWESRLVADDIVATIRGSTHLNHPRMRAGGDAPQSSRVVFLLLKQ